MFIFCNLLRVVRLGHASIVSFECGLWMEFVEVFKRCFYISHRNHSSVPNREIAKKIEVWLAVEVFNDSRVIGRHLRKSLSIMTSLTN